MYEEEDDHLPLAYRNVIFRPDIPDKFRDYTMIQLGMRQFGADSDAMAKLDNEDRVNSAFAAAFPSMHGFQQPQRPADPMQMPLTSPGATTPFQRASFQMPNDWHTTSTMPPQATILSTAQSPGIAPFMPDIHRGSSGSSNGLIRTPSHESIATMRHGSTSSIRSANMERQGSGASMTSSMSHGTPIWPPQSPGMEFDGFFGGPLSATTPMPASHGMSQARSMSVPFPNEPRGNRRRRDDATTPALQSPTNGLPLVSPNHSIPPAKRNRSDAGAYNAHMNRHPFSLEVPGNVQGMVVQQTPGAGFQQPSTPSAAAFQQAMAYNQFQQGLESEAATKTVPRLQQPPRKIKSPTRALKQTAASRPGTIKKEEVDPDEKSSLSTTTTVADTMSPPTQIKTVDEEVSPMTVTKPLAEVSSAQDDAASYPFDSMGGFLGNFGGQDDTSSWGLDFNTDEWPAAPVDAGPFSFDDLLQFPASQSDE